MRRKLFDKSEKFFSTDDIKTKLANDAVKLIDSLYNKQNMPLAVREMNTQKTINIDKVTVTELFKLHCDARKKRKEIARFDSGIRSATSNPKKVLDSGSTSLQVKNLNIIFKKPIKIDISIMSSLAELESESIIYDLQSSETMARKFPDMVFQSDKSLHGKYLLVKISENKCLSFFGITPISSSNFQVPLQSFTQLPEIDAENLTSMCKIPSEQKIWIEVGDKNCQRSMEFKKPEKLSQNNLYIEILKCGLLKQIDKITIKCLVLDADGDNAKVGDFETLEFSYSCTNLRESFKLPLDNLLKDKSYHLVFLFCIKQKNFALAHLDLIKNQIYQPEDGLHKLAVYRLKDKDMQLNQTLYRLQPSGYQSESNELLFLCNRLESITIETHLTSKVYTTDKNLQILLNSVSPEEPEFILDEQETLIFSLPEIFKIPEKALPKIYSTIEGYPASSKTARYIFSLLLCTCHHLLKIEGEVKLLIECYEFPSTGLFNNLKIHVINENFMDDGNISVLNLVLRILYYAAEKQEEFYKVIVYLLQTYQPEVVINAISDTTCLLIKHEKLELAYKIINLLLKTEPHDRSSFISNFLMPVYSTSLEISDDLVDFLTSMLKTFDIEEMQPLSELLLKIFTENEKNKKVSTKMATLFLRPITRALIKNKSTRINQIHLSYNQLVSENLFTCVLVCLKVLEDSWQIYFKQTTQTDLDLQDYLEELFEFLQFNFVNCIYESDWHMMLLLQSKITASLIEKHFPSLTRLDGSLLKKFLPMVGAFVLQPHLQPKNVRSTFFGEPSLDLRLTVGGYIVKVFEELKDDEKQKFGADFIETMLPLCMIGFSPLSKLLLDVLQRLADILLGKFF